MSGKACFLWDPSHDRYCFGPDHPLHPIRLKLTFDLISELGLISPEQLVAPSPVSEQALSLVHTFEYIQAVKTAAPGRNDPSLARFGLGTEDNPVFPDMHAASCLPVGGSLTAADMVISGRFTHALNLGGGLHHAQATRASGFCIYNDAAIAIAYAREKYQVRVAYVDVDAHHGDGVQWAFYYHPDVLTISLHETGRFLFPGTGDISERGAGPGRGYAVNVPLEPFTEDESWQSAFLSVVPPLLRRFRPDIVVSQHGCDGHRFDPLAHLALTTASYELAARVLHSLAHEVCKGRWLALGGGGYDWRAVPRVWTLLWAEMTGQPVPDAVPPAWGQRWQTHLVPPQQMRDLPHEFPPIARRKGIADKNRHTVTALLAGLPPALRSEEPDRV